MTSLATNHAVDASGAYVLVVFVEFLDVHDVFWVTDELRDGPRLRQRQLAGLCVHPVDVWKAGLQTRSDLVQQQRHLVRGSIAIGLIAVTEPIAIFSRTASATWPVEV